MTQPKPPSSITGSSTTSQQSLISFRTETDLTTPSLCSDTEQDGDPSYEDRPPSTPPTSASTGPRNVSIDAPRERISGLSKGRLVAPAGDHFAFNTKAASTREKHVSGDICEDSPTLFSRRPPSSPMPSNSPRRPRPPARARSKSRPIDDDGNDPLKLSYTSTQMEQIGGYSASRTNHPRNSAMRQGSAILSNSSRESSRAPSVGTTSGVTLDYELQRAIESELDEEMESGVFTGVGTRSMKHGYLAHGGAGGIPILIGPGNLQGLEDSDTERRRGARRR